MSLKGNVALWLGEHIVAPWLAQEVDARGAGERMSDEDIVRLCRMTPTEYEQHLCELRQRAA